MAKLKETNREQTKFIQERLTRHLEYIIAKLEDKEFELPARNLATLANSFANLGICSKDLFEILAQRALATEPDPLEGFEPQHLANLANAFAKLGIQPPKGLFEAIAEKALSTKPRPLEGFNSQDLANLADAFVIQLSIQKINLNDHTNENFKIFFDYWTKCIDRIKWSDLSIEQITQIYQSYLFLQSQMDFKLGTEELEKASKILLEQPKPKSSKTHREIAAIVERLFPNEKGYRIENEYPTIGSHADIAVFYKGKEHCVIEVEGPSHFYPGTEILNSKTRFKYYLLGQEWPRLISIPAKEFTKYPLEQEQLKYLEGMIKPIELENRLKKKNMDW